MHFHSFNFGTKSFSCGVDRAHFANEFIYRRVRTYEAAADRRALHGDVDAARGGVEETAALQSQQAQDLCRKLLDKDPRTRISAAHALKHPWFEDGKPSAFGNKEVLSVSIFDGLMKYQAYNKLKRAVLQLLTRELSEFQIQELRNKFMGLDTQGDGLLSPEELIDGMRSVGYQMSDSDLAQIVAALDGTGSQRIGYKEFISALIERRVKFDRQQLWECFKKFDVKGTGKITYEDVKRAMSGSMSESEWQEIAALPGRPDGQRAELTFDEFVALMEQQDC